MLYVLRVLRGQPGKQAWEEFSLTWTPNANVISALMEIQRNPVNRQGEAVTPVVWEQGCLEEVCGSCSMLINGRPRQACTALIATLLKENGGEPITLAPLTKFPLVRDLIVDRSIMFKNLKDVSAWIDTDGAYDRGPGPKMSQEVQELRYQLSTCMTCGCCSEACPQVNADSKFIGPAAISQVALFDAHPTGAMHKAKRLESLMGEGGLSDCGNAQNCEKVCPKKIPLTSYSIPAMARAITAYAWNTFLGKVIGGK
jgi:succinate dehydrogenase / fumarate reductase iron-sulfur subunit